MKSFRYVFRSVGVMIDEVDERNVPLFSELTAPAIFSVVTGRLADQHDDELDDVILVNDHKRIIHESSGASHLSW